MSYPLANDSFPVVLIVGAGLGGLMLGALLESANISYHILERVSEAREFGAAISISGNILPVFEQLGIYEDLKNISLPYLGTEFFDLKLNQVGFVEGIGHKKSCGYDFLFLSRPKLYTLLRGLIPDNKITMGKRVLFTKEHDEIVDVYCSDDTMYECNILVGADGAHSAVRQNMYKQLEQKGKLPLRDKDDLMIGYITTLGIATPRVPEKYPELSIDRSFFRVIIGENSESCAINTVADKQVSWMVTTQVSAAKAKEQRFRNSEWGPESVENVLKEFRDYPCSLGGTMKDLFDATPKDQVSRVFLEEKVFETWQNGRTVLLGDACHKLFPGAGQGAVMAMKDAVVLANCIYAMKDLTTKSVVAGFDNYYKQRFPEAEVQAKNSDILTKVLFGQKKMDKFSRHLMLHFLPYWVIQRKLDSDLAYRPQVNWLPMIETRGTGKVLPQEGRN
ncbi:hypothetical protein BGX27_011477, partial [Mortierella sp. AM989]